MWKRSMAEITGHPQTKGRATGENKLRPKPPRHSSTLLEGSRNIGIGIAFNHKGDLLASGGWEGVLRLWGPRTGTQLFSMPSWGSPVFGPVDRLLASDFRVGKLALLEVAAGGEYRTLIRAAAAGQGS